MQDKVSIHGSWSSRWAFILAALGSTVGLGNIWKFPYIVGENGGGAFILVYLACVAIIGVPLMMAEVMIGRRGRQSSFYSVRDLASESSVSTYWAWVGLAGAVAGFLIFTFYSVVSGWLLAYVFHAANGNFIGAGSDQLKAMFEALLADPKALIIWHSVFVILVMGVLIRGVSRGLEQAIRILMPSLFVLLLLLLMYALTSGSFGQGLDFLFDADFSKLSWNSVLVALGHAFFTLSLGMGTMIVYGSYMSKKESITTSILTVVILDTVVALVAGMVIFPIVFANELDPGSGPGLMFVTLPIVFGNMLGGQVFGFLFFMMVSIAAWSSAISLVEPGVTWLMERYKLSRVQACVFLGISAWTIGVGALLSFNVGKDWRFKGLNIFQLLDFMTANILLPLCGLLITLFAGWWVKRSISSEELGISKGHGFVLWLFTIRFLAPVAISIIFIANLNGKI
ncbi:sodium-dependent transporter [Motiliproteus sp. MSK22-1]|uniref:sodium-dependent transporter n=1 Tax=Motiliproteus sp. MSK22-1 TaxID=1897630 RepID=UPI0009755996|nr:sodium-dependent transporter [Motiliproteus sp. MSK22-1]OMH39354.1 transporter [Motiliproteus sp. MSK22-1]